MLCRRYQLRDRTIQVTGRSGPSFLAIALMSGFLAAGCGTSAQTHASASRTATALAFAKCMRAHGVPSFPDPGSNISGPYSSIGGIQIPATINMHSPAFEGAQSACQGLLSAAVSPSGKPAITDSLKASLIAQAQCMRTHGVPGYQDPVFPPGGGIGFTDAGTDPQSPAYRHAQSVCGGR